MFTGIVTLVLTLIVISRASTRDFYVSRETNLTWTEANAICTLAEPDLVWYNSSIGVNTSVSQHDSWLGYVQSFTTFIYQGCWKSEVLNQQPGVRYLTRRSVGICYSACRTKFFAVDSQNGCKCLNNLDTATADSFSNCNKRCNMLSCGSDGSDQHMSVYRISAEQESNSNSLRCLQLKRDNGENSLNWERCTASSRHSHYIVCRDIYTNESGTYATIGGTHRKWYIAASTCSSATTVQRLQPGQWYWTLTVGIRSIYKASTDKAIVPEAARFGILRLDGSVDFTVETVQLPGLCQKVSTQSTAPDESSQANAKGLYIGLAIGLTLLVVVVVAVVTLLLHKYEIGKAELLRFVNRIFQRNAPSDANVTGPVQTTTASSSAMPVYTVLEPVVGTANSVSVDAHGENVYDESEAVSPEHGLHTNNSYIDVYNIAGTTDSDNDVYDHTNDVRLLNNQGTMNDNLYDVSGTGASERRFQSNEIYNTTNDVDSDGNVYDVSGGCVHGHGFPVDGIYNTTHDVHLDCNVYDVSARTKERQRFPCDDVYSTTTNMQSDDGNVYDISGGQSPGPCFHTDNVYNTTSGVQSHLS